MAKEKKEKEEVKAKAEKKIVEVADVPDEAVKKEQQEDLTPTEDIKPEELDEEAVALSLEKARGFDRLAWSPKTSIGKKVKSGEINHIDQILDNGYKILEAEIVDALMPNLETDLLFVGQSKGKFGGGQRRVFKQTQKKTREGNKPKFATFAVVGNKDGYVGLGYGKSKETVPTREKATRNAKLEIIKIRRGCGSWQCNCKEPHSVPFCIVGKCGSSTIKLMPAPKGTGLCVAPENQKLLEMAGIKDVWSDTEGQTAIRTNMIMACFNALRKLMKMKINTSEIAVLGIVEGEAPKKQKAEDYKEVSPAAEAADANESKEKKDGSQKARKK